MFDVSNIDSLPSTDFIAENIIKRPFDLDSHNQSLPGTGLSSKEVIFLFESHKDTLVKMNFIGSFIAIRDENGLPILSQPLLESLSYIAQMGNVEVNDFLLSQYEHFFREEFINGDRSFKAYLFNTYNSDFSNLNRLIPSERKIKLLLDLYGLDPNCGPTSHGGYDYTTGDVIVAQFLLLNYEEFIKPNNYLLTGRNPYHEEQKKLYKNNGLTTCDRLIDHTTIVMNHYNSVKDSLHLRNTNSWKYYEIPSLNYY